MTNPRKPAHKRPGPQCPVCAHTENEAIDIALATGVETRAEIGRRYALDRSALYRHAHGGHLDDRLVDNAAEAASDAAEGLIDRVVALADRLERRLALRDADADGLDMDVARLARELRSVLDLFARVSGQLIERVELTDRVGRWHDSDVVALVDGLLGAIECDWPDAAQAARTVVVTALSNPVERAPV
jgi:hypothetical protein